MKCSQCGHYEESGNFCPKCGSPLAQENVEQEEKVEYVSPKPTSSSTSVNVEQVKKTAQNYGLNFMSLLKKPTAGNDNDSNFINGIISLVLFSLVLGLMVTQLGNKFFGLIIGLFSGLADGLGGFGLGSILDEFKIFSFKYIFIFAIIAVVTSLATIAVVFFVNKLFVQERSFKSVLVNITNYYPTLIVGALAAYIILLADFVKVGLAVALFVSLIAYTIIPVLVLASHMQNKETKFDKFFIFLMTIAAILILSYIINEVSSGLLTNMIEKDSEKIIEKQFENWW